MKYPKNKTKTITIDSFRSGLSAKLADGVLPLCYGKKIHNFSVARGALEPGIGLAELEPQLSAKLEQIPNKRALFHFKRLDQFGERRDFLIVLSGTDLVALDLDGSGEPRTIWHDFCGQPIATNYNLNSRDVIIFSSTEGPMIVWDGEHDAYAVADAPSISSMSIHFERLFATSSGPDKNSVWFSDDFDPTNWTPSLLDAGFVQMIDERGACLRVVSFLDYLFVFREYGIARISAFGDQSQFALSQLSCSSGKIYPQTVTLCGDVVLFLAEDGLYSFNGVQTTKIFDHLSHLFLGANNLDAKAVAHGGKWYLLANIIEENEQGEDQEHKVLFELDQKRNQVVCSVGLGATELLSVRTEQGSMLLVLAGEGEAFRLCHSGKIKNTPLHAVWQSAWSDLGLCAQFVVRQVSLSSKTLATVRLETEKHSQTLHFGANFPETQNCCVCGRKLRVSIETELEQETSIFGLQLCCMTKSRSTKI